MRSGASAQIAKLHRRPDVAELGHEARPELLPPAACSDRRQIARLFVLRSLAGETFLPARPMRARWRAACGRSTDSRLRFLDAHGRQRRRMTDKSGPQVSKLHFDDAFNLMHSISSSRSLQAFQRPKREERGLEQSRPTARTY